LRQSDEQIVAQTNALGIPSAAILFFLRPDRISDLASDSAAGVTVGLIALPLALALGIASVPAGTATPIRLRHLACLPRSSPAFSFRSLGGSRVQIGGPTAAFAPVVLLVIEKHGYGGLIVATIMAGSFQMTMGLARMGSLIKFIPWPVTSGFTTGIAVSIMAAGAPDLFGIRSATSPPAKANTNSWIDRGDARCHHLAFHA
jgi:SulP family sulfate permease